jgi:uncharacterized membrane protein
MTAGDGQRRPRSLQVRLNSTRTLTRVIVAGAMGMLTGGVAVAEAPWQVAALVGWDVAAVVFLSWVLSTIYALTGEQTRTVATRFDPNRAVAHVGLVAACLMCLLGVGYALLRAEHTGGSTAGSLVLLAIISVLASWAVLHTVSLLHYARLYYTPPEGGVDFNSDALPEYSDFAYLAFTVGMTYQVSDTNLTTEAMRRAVLTHAVLSFVFGTIILAVTINVVAGLIH